MHSKTGQKCPVFEWFLLAQTVLLIEKINFLLKMVQAILPFEIRTKCPVFEWFSSLDRYICTEKNILSIKWSRLIYHSKTRRFCPVFEWFSLDRFIYKEKNVLYKKRSRLIYHSKTGPFENRTKVDHSKTGHVRFSDPHCISIGGFFRKNI